MYKFTNDVQGKKININKTTSIEAYPLSFKEVLIFGTNNLLYIGMHLTNLKDLEIKAI